MKFSMNEVLTAMRAKGLHDEVAAVGIVLQQRAELLEALKRVLPIAEDGVEQYGGGADDHEDIVFARKAEANAEK